MARGRSGRVSPGPGGPGPASNPNPRLNQAGSDSEPGLSHGQAAARPGPGCQCHWGIISEASSVTSPARQCAIPVTTLNLSLGRRITSQPGSEVSRNYNGVFALVRPLLA